MSQIQTITSLNPKSYDFDELMDSAVRWMRTQDEWKDFDFTGSGIRELMRILAYFAQQQAFQNNFMFSEANIQSSQIPNNVYSFASSVLGYLPRGKRAARLFLPKITVVPEQESSTQRKIVLDKSTRFYSMKDSRSVVFSPIKEYEAYLNEDGEYVFENVELVQGIWVTSTYTVQSVYSVESFIIENSDIDVDTLNQVIVKPNDTSSEYSVYERFKDAYYLGSESKTFFMKKNRDGKYEIEFGDDRLAKRLEFGNVVVARYLVTDGSTGNGIRTVYPSSSIGGYYNIIIEDSDTASYGGDDEEDIATTKIYAPLVYESQGAAVNSSSYEAIVKTSYPHATDVIAWGGEDNDPPKYGYVFISVKSKDGSMLSESQKKELIDLLDQRNVGSITPLYSDSSDLTISLSVDVRYNPNMTVLEHISMRVKIEDYIKRFSKNKLERFRATLDYSELSQYINSIDTSITGNFIKATMSKHIAVELEASYSYKTSFYTAIKPKSVKITGFKVLDENFFENTYEIRDNGEGVLQIYRIREDGRETQITSDSGVVDYATGVINISNFSPSYVVDANRRILVNVEPKTQDFLAASRNDIISIGEVNVDLREANKSNG